MNDRYLFKAKRIDWNQLPKEKWWVVGYYVEGDGTAYIYDTGKRAQRIYEIDESTLCLNFLCGGQSLDGKLIWENDIVTTEDGEMGIVRFGAYDSTYFGFYIEWLKEKYWRKDIVYWLPKIKSITNIFDNPELLEVEW